ncbi:hypothetical protein [Prevotella sp. P2-180]|nr:hypothetical protein [Prevotella sp. P2-180]
MNENSIKSKPLGIPYGMMNFVAIREDNYYYVDKICSILASWN